MDINRLRQIEEIYDAAQACEPKERAVLLDRADPDVKGDVELLLAQNETWLDRPAWEGVTKTALQELATEQGASQRETEKQVVNIASLPGTVLDGKYKIERQLDKGGMGAVFLAIHMGTTRTVAVKVIVPRLASQDEFLRRFQREAQAAGRLRHPNVVNVTDFGAALLDRVPLAYLVMEFLDGQNLSHFLKANPRPAADEILDIVDQVALALDAAHESGVVHRDLKPDNIWLQPNHRRGFYVKVLDFGIAKLHDSPGAGSADLEAIPALSISADASTYLETTAGSVLGTPAYMAPEQCRGTDVDARADIYSLAVIVYQMFCGCLPFNAKGLRDLLQKQIEELPTPPMAVDPGISRRVSQAIMEGLAKDPASRPPSASAFAAQLRVASEGELKPLAEGKIIANNYGSCFFPMLLACFAPYIPVMAGLNLGARAIPGMAAVPSLVVGAVFQILIFAGLFFLSQIYKAGATLLLAEASAAGHFQRQWRPQFLKLVRGSGSLVATHLRNSFDLRPRSFLAGQLWPVVWASEGLSGRAALTRAVRLVRTEPATAAAVAARQWGTFVITTLFFPCLIALMGASEGYGRLLTRPGFAWFAIFYPLFMSVLGFRFFGPAFFFLYISARRCLGETVNFSVPSARRERRSRRAAAFRPATIAWLLAPVLMSMVIVYKSIPRGMIAYRLPDLGSKFELFDAVSEGRRTAARRMLQSGMSVNSSDRGGWTPLMLAISGGDMEFARELVARHADVNARNSSGDTALLLALGSRRSAEAAMLIASGANVGISNEDGHTPLIVAAMHGDTAICRLLLERGADRGYRDRRGMTALGYAEEEGQSEVVALLTTEAKR